MIMVLAALDVPERIAKLRNICHELPGLANGHALGIGQADRAPVKRDRVQIVLLDHSKDLRALPQRVAVRPLDADLSAVIGGLFGNNLEISKELAEKFHVFTLSGCMPWTCIRSNGIDALPKRSPRAGQGYPKQHVLPADGQEGPSQTRICG